MLRIAVQKSGRLADKSRQILQDCGISFQQNGGKLFSRAANFPLEILYLRDDDIPQYVEEGIAQLGIVGRNVILEKGRKVEEVRPLGFGKCRLSLAVPRDQPYSSVRDFQGRRIATSYPAILSSFLQDKGIGSEIEVISGSVEIAPGIGLAGAICDLVSSGSTLLINGLKEVETVLESEAVLIRHRSFDTEQQRYLEKLLFRLDAVQKARTNKYILLNAPDASLERIAGILPGMKSPTVMPLATPGWSTLHSVVAEDDFWNVIDALRDAGAEGILVLPIEKMIV